MTDVASSSALETPTLPTFVDPAPHSAFEKRPRRGPGLYDRTLPPEVRRDEQRRTLVEAAAHVFARDGFANASVASLLEASGLSRGTFYRHFDDLRSVFIAVQQNAADALVSRVDAVFAGAPDPKDKLHACVGAYLELCAEVGDLLRVLHREAAASGGDCARERARSRTRMQSLFREGLKLAFDRGSLKKMPDDLTIIAVIGAIEGVALRYLEEHREHELSEAQGPLVELALRAFA